MRPAIERIEAVHLVARALRARSGMERLRLAHDEWEMARNRIGIKVAERLGLGPLWEQIRKQAE